MLKKTCQVYLQPYQFIIPKSINILIRINYSWGRIIGLQNVKQQAEPMVTESGFKLFFKFRRIIGWQNINQSNQLHCLSVKIHKKSIESIHKKSESMT